MLLFQPSQVLANVCCCSGKVRLLVRKLFPCSPPAAGRTAAFPFLVLHALLSPRLFKKKLL